jgi:hypothetical protein
MYRGSRLAASFLLVLTGSAAAAVALFVVPGAVGGTGARWLTVVAIAFAILHLTALVGVARGRDWGRNSAVFVAEMGGGLAVLAGVALVVGARPLGAMSVASGLAFVAWTAAVYALLGIAAGRVPVLDRLTPIERWRLVGGPSVAAAR